MPYKPFDYQLIAEQFILDHPAAGLLLDMGMGKTVITLTAISKLKPKKTLVIAPLRPAIEVWPAEIEKWEHLKSLSYSLVIGAQAKRIKALETPADIYIINRENVVWLVNYYGAKWPFDMVIIDELSSFKSPKAQRFRALKKVRKYINRVVGLTGTPAPNSLLDLWPEMYLLDEGEALGKTYTGFRDRYFLPDKRNAQVIFTWKPKPGAEQEIYKRIQGLCLSMQVDLHLPERLFLTHAVELSKRGRHLYDTLERDTLLPFIDGDIDAPTAAVLAGKLLQAAGGAAYDENGNVKILHNDKLDMLDELVEEANGQPLIIFYNYRHEQDRIIKRYSAIDIRATGAIAAWNRGEIPIMVAHPASAGHGLNLQSGGHIAIWYGLPTSLELYQQANKRLHRPGQTQTVLIHHIIAKNTYDEKVYQMLQTKEKRQDALINSLKARLAQLKQK